MLAATVGKRALSKSKLTPEREADFDAQLPSSGTCPQASKLLFAETPAQTRALYT